MQMEYDKLDNFLQITRYILKADKYIVSTKN